MTMSLHTTAAVAGTVSTVLFVTSYLPMLVKAARTRDLESYSLGNLVVANVGNVVHTVYIVSLPVGPIWVLHGFYLGSTALMMWWWLRYRGKPRPDRDRSSSDGGAVRRLGGQERGVHLHEPGGPPEAGSDLSFVGSPSCRARGEAR